MVRLKESKNKVKKPSKLAKERLRILANLIVDRILEEQTLKTKTQR